MPPKINEDILFEIMKFLRRSDWEKLIFVNSFIFEYVSKKSKIIYKNVKILITDEVLKNNKTNSILIKNLKTNFCKLINLKIEFGGEFGRLIENKIQKSIWNHLSSKITFEFNDQIRFNSINYILSQLFKYINDGNIHMYINFEPVVFFLSAFNFISYRNNF